MSVIISQIFESPRGQTELSADLSGLTFSDMVSEVKQFFSASLVVKCDILKQIDEYNTVKESPAKIHEPNRELEEVMVLS